MLEENNVLNMLNEPLPANSEYNSQVLTWFTNKIPEKEPDEIEVPPLIYEDKEYDLIKAPYYLFDDQYYVKKALTEAFFEKDFLLLCGYSGCGKTTMLMQLAEQNPDSVFYFPKSGEQGPSILLGKIADRLNISVKQRTSELDPVIEALKQAGRIMLIFDDLVLSNNIVTLERLKMITTIYDETNLPIVIAGDTEFYRRLYDDRHFTKYGSILSRLITYEMKGMKPNDAHNYLKFICRNENINIPVNARQALVNIAVTPKHGGIRKFIKILREIITKERAKYYTSPGHKIPENAKCVDYISRSINQVQTSTLIYILPKTPEVLIPDSSAIQSTIAKHIASLQQPPKHRSKKHSKSEQDDTSPENFEES